MPGSDWLKCSKVAGKGEADIAVSVDPTGLPPGEYRSTLAVASPEAYYQTKALPVQLKIYGESADTGPFGRFESPQEGSRVSGNIPVTGWALDDIGVDRVIIKRNAHPLDPPAAVGKDGLVYVGDGIFVKGARPDVAKVYPEYPSANLAGWGYMLLTNLLPDEGQGMFTFHAFAVDGSGHTVKLGEKTVECNNRGRKKPFGTIDTPGQGETISGASYVNFGWALTPQPKTIPRDGSTIQVWLDGKPLGNVDYNHYRKDIAALFPQYNNADGAVGFFSLDTFHLTGGMHSIAWSVEDDMGWVDGIGSRYFHVRNEAKSGTELIGRHVEGSEFRPKNYDASQIAHLKSLPVDASGRLRLELKKIYLNWMKDDLEIEGYGINKNHICFDGQREGRFQILEDGKYLLEIEEAEHVVLGFEIPIGMELWGWGDYERGGSLPAGAALDSREGFFYWLPPPGFLGEHTLYFAMTDRCFRGDVITVVFSIKPADIN